MISRTLMARVFAGAIACAFFALAPEAKSVGAVRMRLPGTACQTYGQPGISEVGYNQTTAFLYETVNGNEVVCPIPLGTDLVETDDTNGRKLNYVHVLYEIDDFGEDQQLTLWAQDYAGYAGCICDSDTLTVEFGGFYNTNLNLNGDSNTTGCDTGCMGGQLPTDWPLSVHIWLQSAQVGGATLRVLMLRVVDT